MNENFSIKAGKIILVLFAFGIFASQAIAASINLAWDASPSSNVVGYTVYYGNRSGVYSTQTNIGNQTSLVVQGIDRRTNYFFAVTARTMDDQHSLPSNEVNLQPEAETIIESGSGIFNGLFSGPPPQLSSGFFTLKKGSRTSFTGSIKLGGKQLSFSGKFNSAGFSNTLIKRLGATPLTLQMHLDPLNPDIVAVTLLDGERMVEFSADRAVFHALTAPAPYAGKYTIAIAGVTAVLAVAPVETSPEGIGFAALKVSSNGIIKVTGNLGDGEKFVQSTYVSKNGTWPCYVPLYGKAGLISGSLTFQTGEAGPQGGLLWSKPALPKHRLYPKGFSNSVTVIGSPYVPPVTLTNRVLNFENGTFILGGNHPAGGLAKDVRLSLDNKIFPLAPGEDGLVVTIRKNVGTFSGIIKLPGHTRPVKFKGGLLQNQNAGYGHFLGTNQSGELLLEPTL